MRRNAFIRRNGNFPRTTDVASGEIAALTAFTTSPRLTGLAFTRAVMTYQLMSAKVMPVSFSAIHVPPPGSDGQRIFRPATTRSFGGSPVARESFSSRFMASA